MAKRQRDDRGMSLPGQREQPAHRSGQNQRGPPALKKSKPSHVPTKEPKEQVLRGNIVRGAALLTQLLSELASDSQARGEMEDLIGSEATNAVMKLHQSLQPKEGLIRELLHQQPKLPEPELPLPQLPSSLPQALTGFVGAHKHTVPALPEIKDGRLAELPFIHRSWHNNDHRKAVSDSYERLELLGDAYLEIIATRLLYPLFPDLPAGRLSNLRETLVCNETLARFSMAYGLHERVRVPDTYLEEGTNRKAIWKKLLGDVFEAYVAAVIMSDPDDGFRTAEDWLRRLWAPKLPGLQDLREPDKAAKQELQKKLGGVGVRLSYEMDKEPVPFKGGQYWYISVWLKGWGWEREKLGSYEGRSKQVAEAGAAEAAMANPLLAQIVAVKRKYDEETRKARSEAANKASALGNAATNVDDTA